MSMTVLRGVIAAITLLSTATAAAQESPFPEAVDRLVKRAESRLDAGPFSVMDKEQTAPSGDKHDFYSLSPYHWPNPETPDGLPYIFRDGEVNPEVRGPGYDRDSFGKMGDAVEGLSLAYRHTGDERFAARSTLLLRTWFIHAETRMNPNLEYAQHIRGTDKQKSWGIIHGNQLVTLARAVDWIAPSDAWTEADTTAWRAWLRDYVTWLTTSSKGLEEERAGNNHGTWYDVQAASLALASGDESVAGKILGRVGERRITRQIAPDGRQPFEMLRTKSWDYSVMNLEGLFELARLADRVEIDLWNFRTQDGRCMRAALDYLVPAATGKAKWGGKQIVEFRPEKLYPLLRRAAIHYECPAYLDAARKIPNTGDVAIEDWLQWPEIEKR